MLYKMVICVQMYLELEKLYWKLLDKGDLHFINSYYTLDNSMKQCTAKGLGVKQCHCGEQSQQGGDVAKGHFG